MKLSPHLVFLPWTQMQCWNFCSHFMIRRERPKLAQISQLRHHWAAESTASGCPPPGWVPWAPPPHSVKWTGTVVCKHSDGFGYRQYYAWAVLSHFNPVQLFVTLQTVVHQAPLSMGFSRQKYWSVLPCSPPLGDLPDPGIEPASCISCIGRQVLYH